MSQSSPAPPFRNSRRNLIVKAKELGSEIKSYFNLSEDLEPQADAEQAIRSGVSFKGSQLLVLIFAIFIASLGLNTNSVPVIIGAMLISPLMGPIIGMGLAIGIEDYSLLRRGFKNIVMAVLGSVLASAVYFLISPQYEGSSQLLARTSPSIYDVLIALFGGAAGIISIACKNKGQVMPGVAIATSLMPPLCTAGYGLATLQSKFFFGALYLFTTNTVFILFATWICVKLLGYRRVVAANPRRHRAVQTLVYTIVALTIGLSAYLTIGMIRTSIFMAKASEFVEKEMVFPNTQVLNHSEIIKDGRRIINVTLIGEALPKDSLQLAMLNKLDSAGLYGTTINIKQGFSLDTKANDFDEDMKTDRFYTLMQQQLASRQNEIDSLKSIVKSEHTLQNEGHAMASEVKVLFPEISDIALAHTFVTNTANGASDTISFLIVNSPQAMNAKTRAKLADYARIRLNRKNLQVIVNPASFPWTATNTSDNNTPKPKS